MIIRARPRHSIVATSSRLRVGAALGRPVLLLFSLLGILVAPAYAQNAPSPLAQEVAKQIAKLRGSSTKPFRIAVLPFKPLGKEATQVGAEIASDLAAQLTALSPDVAIANNEELDSELAHEDFWLSSLVDERVAWALGPQLGLDFILMGTFKPREQEVELRVQGVVCRKEGKVFRFNAKYAGSEDLWRRLRQDQPLVLPGQSESRGGAFPSGVGGIGEPSCLVCPDPKFTPEARAAKFESGFVILRLIVTPDGHAESVSILRELPYGLTQNAVESVRSWQFKPALGPDGKPVPVWVTVEVTFRLLP